MKSPHPIASAMPRLRRCPPSIAVAAAILVGCEPNAAIPAPENEATLGPAAPAELMELPRPLWTIDPKNDVTSWMLDDVSTDITDGVPESLRGLRPDPDGDYFLRSLGGVNDVCADCFKPALSRQDFIDGARGCVRHISYGGYLLKGVFESVEEQEYWLASLRAKEAVYGEGGPETACEREYFRAAGAVARGYWWSAIYFNPVRQENQKTIDGANSEISAVVVRVRDYQGTTPEVRWPGDPSTVERLKRWGVNPALSYIGHRTGTRNAGLRFTRLHMPPGCDRPPPGATSCKVLKLGDAGGG